MKIYQLQIIFVLLFAMVACKKSNAKKEEQTVEPATAKITNAKFQSGRYRAKLSWKLSGEVKVIKCKIYWNEKKDSTEVVVPSGKDTMSTIINGLTEGSHSFSVYAHSDKGIASTGTSISGQIYGDTYENTLKNRAISRVDFSEQTSIAVINWNSSAQGTLGVELKHAAIPSPSKSLFIPLLSTTTTLTNCGPDDEFIYRTLYVPQPLAIDTFYSEYNAVPVKQVITPPDENRLTKGWTQTAYTYQIQSPYDIPESDRYSYANGEHRFWIFPTDKAHTPESDTGPRSEFRMKNDYLLGRHQFEGDVYVVAGSAGTDVMQVFGGVTNATSFMMKIHSANNGTLRRYDNEILLTNAYNRWIHVNVQHDADNGKVYVYLDGNRVGIFDDRGKKTHYFKCGTYNITGARSESRWKNIRYWKDGPIDSK